MMNHTMPSPMTAPQFTARALGSGRRVLTPSTTLQAQAAFTAFPPAPTDGRSADVLAIYGGAGQPAAAAPRGESSYKDRRPTPPGGMQRSAQLDYQAGAPVPEEPEPLPAL